MLSYRRLWEIDYWEVQIMSKAWWKAAGIRALKTVAQAAVSMLTIGQAVIDINWVNVLSVSAVAGVISMLTSIAGLPEVDEEVGQDD
jgi:hypothetical protein